MAIIGKIRSHSRLLVGIIGIALVFFMFSTFFENIPNTIKKLFSGRVEYGIGTVYGEQVNGNSYNILAQNLISQDQQQALQAKKEYTDKDRENSTDKAWNILVDSTILSKEYEALGISVSEKEFDAYLMATNGFPVLQDVAQLFTDSLTGKISEKSTALGRKKLQSEIKRLKSSKDPAVVKQWAETKKSFTERIKQEKYLSLLDQAVFVTNLEAEAEYYEKNETKNISFVVRRYTDVADSDVKVSDSDLIKFYENHKSDKKYAHPFSSREVKLFEIKVAPSKEDSLQFNNVMSKLSVEFSKSENDSLFVTKNSERAFYYSDKRATAVPEGNPKADKFQTYPIQLDSVFKKASIGQIVGPYYMEENSILSKVIGFTPSRLKARHLLIATNSSTDKKVLDSKTKLADSLLKVINKDNFTELVKKYSEDPGSKETGGLYENFLEGEMVKEFASFCATQPIGKIGLVKTDFGYHIIEIIDRDESKLPLLVSIVKKIKASDEALQTKENEVNDVLSKLYEELSKVKSPLKKIETFDKILEKQKYSTRLITIKDNSPKIDGLSSISAMNAMLKFAYSKDASVGDLITNPIKDNGNYVVVMISAIKQKGILKFEDVQKLMKEDLIIEIKAKRLIKEMSKYESIEALTKASNTTIMNAEITFSNPQITGGGYEPEIIGALFASVIKDKNRTLPLKGKTGVYVIRIDKTTKAPATANYNVEREQLLTAFKGSVQGQAVEALRKKADVVDNRKLNELRVRL